MKNLRLLKLAVTAAALLAVLSPAGALAAPPANDDFAYADVLAGRFGWVDGDTTEATKEPGEPNHAGNPGGASVWYAWTAPHAGVATIDLCWAEFDTLLAVYTGDQLTDLQEVVSNDDGCGSQSQVTFATTASTTYRIAVDGADGEFGYFELSWSLGPANDDFVQAASIGGDAGTIEGNSFRATREAGEPEHGGPGGASVWYRWEAPSNGPATFDLCNAEFDTLLGVYTGDNVSGLTRVAVNDDDCGYGSRVSFLASAGQVYRVAVDGFYGEQGDFTLQWNRLAIAPRNHVSPSILGTPRDGAILSTTTGEWGGTPPLTFGYQWYRCSVTGTDCRSIGGATAATYALTSPDVGWRIRVQVTATNSAGASTAISGLTGIVSPVAPANVVPPSVPDRPYLGEDVAVEGGEWSGSEPLDLTYQWQRCSAAGECADIPGETGDVHTVVAADLKNRLRVFVTASNGAGSATAATALTVRVTRRPICLVPRVKGKALARARKAIRRAHCSVGRVRRVRSARPRGRVVSQSLKPGARKAAGTKVNLVVSRGPSR